MRLPTRKTVDHVTPWFDLAAVVGSIAIGYLVAWLVGTDHAVLAISTCDAVVPSGVAPPPCPPLGAVLTYRAVDPVVTVTVGLVVLVLALWAWRSLSRRTEAPGEA